LWLLLGMSPARVAENMQGWQMGLGKLKIFVCVQQAILQIFA